MLKFSASVHQAYLDALAPILFEGVVVSVHQTYLDALTPLLFEGVVGTYDESTGIAMISSDRYCSNKNSKQALRVSMLVTLPLERHCEFTFLEPSSLVQKTPLSYQKSI